MDKNTETLSLTAEQAFKSRKNFEDFVKDCDKGDIIRILVDYPQADGKVVATNRRG